MPAVHLGDVLQRLELPGGHGAGADVAHPALLDHVVERAHDLLAVDVLVQAVDLQHVHVGAEALDARLDGVEDGLARQAGAVGHRLAEVVLLVLRGAGEEALGEDDELLARDLVLGDGLGDDLFGAAVAVVVSAGLAARFAARGASSRVGSPIHVGRVPGGDAGLVGVLEERQRGLLIQHPVLPFRRAVAHAPDNDLGDLEAGLAEAARERLARDPRGCLLRPIPHVFHSGLM